MGPGPVPSGDALLSAYACSLIRSKAQQLCRRPTFSRSDQADLEQDLTVALLKQAPRYDPSRGASADTFANRVINSAVKMILRDRRRQKRAAGYSTVSLDTGTVQVRGKWIPIKEIVGASDRRCERKVSAPDAALLARDEAVARALADLSPHLAMIARRLAEVSIAGLARELGVSRREVYAALALIRARLAARGLGGG